MELSTIINDVVISKACSIKPFKESDEKKVINLNVKFDGCTLESVLQKAVSGAVIQWQNGPGRSNFDKWENNQTVEVSFKAPGATNIDPKQALLNEARLAGVDVNDMKALTSFIMARITD